MLFCEGCLVNCIKVTQENIDDEHICCAIFKMIRYKGVSKNDRMG